MTIRVSFGYYLLMRCLLPDTIWQSVIGDPRRIAWIIVASYFVTCCLCLSASRSQRVSSDGCVDIRSKRFWFAVAALMFLLCLNKQFDLETLITQFGRSLSRREGWYNERRSIQATLVFGCTLAGLAAVMASSYVVRGRWRQCGLAYLGIVFLLTFVIIRALSLHQVDVLLYHLPIVGRRMNTGLELGGAALVAVGALLAIRKPSPNSQQTRLL